MKSKLLRICFFFLISFTSFSQSFIEKQLPKPENVNSFFIGPLAKSAIHYGARPANFNGEIILFNHGYIDLNQLLFTNNTFYQDAFNEGYQVVFVATTRGEGMWVNGKLLAESIDIITHKYNVENLYIIAHSNGGKASEVAMYTHGKKDKVKRVFALGTPYWGTYLADITQQWWFNWLWKATGLNGGGATSTTYYCSNVVRPYFDNHPYNEPEKFFILGGSTFSGGSTPLAPVMLFSGAILYTHQGTNDGVSPYSSTLRPNGNYLFKQNQAQIDHIDIALGQYVWKFIKPYLKDYYPRKNSSNTRNTPTYASKVISDYQIINSENTYDKVILDKGNQHAKLNIFHKVNSDAFNLTLNNGYLTPENKKDFTTNKHNSSYLLSKEKKLELLPIQLEANSKFVAFIHQPNGPKMTYEALEKNKNLIVSFQDTKANLATFDVNAIITKTSDLYGNKVNDAPSVYSFTYNSVTNNFTLDTSSFHNGIYSIHLTGTHNDFNRSLVSGFTVGNISDMPIKALSTPKESTQFSAKLKSNFIKDHLEIVSTSAKNNQIIVEIYNLNGQRVLYNQSIRTDSSYRISTDKLQRGLYLVKITINAKKKNFKIIKQ
ncbi:T9SS type A sorting domain-containing protein [Tenacibaculum maritimum]|uniref:T9SS type A sorting domain-containing protein n=1 Tax=Tenacibaculum maritimum TaxID=107401 RepID=UPI0038769868